MSECPHTERNDKCTCGRGCGCDNDSDNGSDNPNLSLGHGHVFPRPDGAKARCGGPGLCRDCARDQVTAQLPRDQRPRLTAGEIAERKAAGL